MSASLQRERFVAELVAWLNRKLAPPGTRIGADTPLFESGLINSIRVLELIAWVERALGGGRRVADREIRLDNFRTVNRIADVFVRDVEHVDA